MNEFSGNTPLPRDQESEATRLNRWIEAGFSDQAVAGYGGSVSLISNILRTKQLPPFPKDNMFAYQQKLTEGGKHLYYAVPFVDRIANSHPDFASAILINNAAVRIDDSLPFNLIHDNVRSRLADYAHEQSLCELIIERTGRGIHIGSFDVLGLAEEIIPDTYYAFQQATERESLGMDEDAVDINKNPEVMTQVRSLIPQEELSGILEESLKRRGVIIYFTQDMLTNAQLYAGVEEETEIMVVTEQPLSIDVISGIEVPSAADRQALGI